MALWRPLVILSICLFALHKTALCQDYGESRSFKEVCGVRGPLVEALAEMYGEKQAEVKVLGPNRVVELFTNPDTGTWTIMITSTAGTSCLVDSGRDGRPS